MLHMIKIQPCYLFHIMEGIKPFEIRKNDRDYQAGDIIRFLPLEDENYSIYAKYPSIPDFKILYVLADFNGLQQNHVALTIKPMEE